MFSLFALLLAACTGKPAAVTTGNLVLEAENLPAGATATVQVAGAADFSRALAVPGKHELKAGDYVLSAPAMTHEGSQYAGTLSNASMTIHAGKDATVTVTYAPEPTAPGDGDGGSGDDDPDNGDDDEEEDQPALPTRGNLKINITGLPAAVTPGVLVTGPDAFSTEVFGSIELEDLRPEDYLISGHDFLSPDDRYFTAPPEAVVTVAAGATVTHQVEYSELVGRFGVVTNSSDDETKSGSLRQRLNEAVLNPAIDRIIFSSGSFPGSGPHIIEVGSTLTIASNVTVTGLKGAGGAPLITLKAAGANFHLVEVEAGAKVELVDLELREATTAVDGGAIYNSGDLTLRNVTVRDNEAGIGAGIYNHSGALLTLHGSLVEDNSAAGFGGGIANLGSATLHGSQVTGNSSVLDGGGILNMNADAELILIGSEISGNTSGASGGGIRSTVGSVELSGSTVAGNSAESGGGISSNGPLQLSGDSEVSGNDAAVRGGGIHLDVASPRAVVTRTLISGNSAGLGAGIWTGSELEVSNSVVTDNSAGLSGGGIYSNVDARLTISGSEITANRAENAGGQDMQGGGIRSLGVLRIAATTISGNSARLGGGLAITAGDASIEDAVIADNIAVTGGGIYKTVADLRITDTTIERNQLNPALPVTGDIGNGAGIFNSQDGYLTIHDSTITGNTTPHEIGGTTVLTAGGGVHSSLSVNIFDSTISDNSATTGAGIHSATGGLTLSRSTVSGNRGRLNGGGIFSNTHLSIVSSTITDNTAA